MMKFLPRWVFAFALLALTYNPTPYSWAGWTLRSYQEQLPLIVLSGLLLLIGYIIYLRATVRSIGVFGVILVLAVFAALLWVLYDLGWLDINNASLNLWLGILAGSLVMGIGLSWSHIRRSLSGQADMDDVDE